MSDRWDFFDRDDKDDSSSRSRIFENLEEPNGFRSRSSDRRSSYSSYRSEDASFRDSDEYRRSRVREDDRNSSAEEYAGLGNVSITSPKSYKDVQEMIESLARKESIIVNLEGIEESSAQRVLDFLSGASYALGGSMRRIKEFTFLVTPQGTGITDNDGGYYNR